MNRHRCLVFTILVYALIDASALDLPGAFVFDPDDSVEASLTGGAGRTVLRRMAVAPASKLPVPALAQFHDNDTSPPTAVAAERVHRPIARVLRMRLCPPPSLEDPF